MNTQKIMFLILLFFSINNFAHSQSSKIPTSIGLNVSSQVSIFNQLEREDILEITIKTDLRELLSGEGAEKYISTEFSYKHESGDLVNWSIEARQRGKYRRRVCDFPPIKLRFDKKDLAGKDLSSFHTLKLVTHCVEDGYLGKIAVLKEYLAYQLYEELTDKSLKTQLVRVTYVDSKKRMSKIKRYGFLIENHHEMAARLEASIADYMNPDLTRMNSEQEMMLAMFQYMIGNEDWDLQMVRNVKLVETNKGTELYAIPYDFDFAGLVNASYAVPDQDLGLNSVKDRAFQGHYRDKVGIESILDYFQLKKAALYEIVNEFALLNRTSRKRAIRYLDEFFLEMEYDKIIKSDQSIEVAR